MIWDSNLAYIVGLIATDGNLSKDGRHLDFTSKDKDLIETFILLLSLSNKIDIKKGTYDPTKTYYRVQFGSVKFYRFLKEIGLEPNKSKTLGALKIPDNYFVDFLRGSLDGDGYTYSFWDKIFPNSFRLYCVFLSASEKHIFWIRDQIKRLFLLEGKTRFVVKSIYELKFAKANSINLLKKIYYKKGLPCLERKRFKIEQALSIISKQADVL